MKAWGYGLLVVVLLLGAGGKRVFAEGALSTEERLKILEQEVAILKRQIELDKETAAQKAKDAPIVTANAKDGFQIKAQDDSYKLKVSGYAQADARFFGAKKKDQSTTDTFYARTVRLVISGTVANNFDYFISPEFGSTAVSLPDAYMDWRFDPALKFRAGKFKAPFGYERLQSTPGSTFAEPGILENLAPNRDVGVQVFGDLFKESVNYTISLSNGVTDGSTSVNDNNNHKDVGARIFAHPFKNTDLLAFRGLGLGGAVSYGHRKDTTLPSYKTAGQTTFFTLAGPTFDGPQIRYSPQVAYYFNGLGLYGEYMSSESKVYKANRQQRLKNDGWQAAGSYVLTGEDASYKGVVPLHPVDFEKGAWGAWELAVRYSTLKLDDAIFDSSLTTNTISSSPSEASAWTLGLNWYLNRNAKLVFNFERTQYKDGASSGNARPTENLVLSRMQLSF
ncbi:MAG: hypothetical protein HQL21_05415 [Candidatus Omnitrophica bacterium]|nr:hypothetical protein [Candidatus Omnitrophota bacterium]